MNNCKNCGAELEKDAGYCSYCGARVLDDKITLRFLFSEILDKVLSVDNKLLKTFFHLFTKPHKVIEDYVRGVRKRYFNPFNYILISITLAGISSLITREYTMELVTSANQQMNPEAVEANRKMMDFFFDYQSIITILSIPFYAFVSWIIFLNKKKFNYLEHNIVYIYTSGHLSIINFLMVGVCYVIGVNWYFQVSLIAASLLLVYNSYVLIRLFKLSFLQFIIKSLYFLFIGGMIYVIVVIFTIIIMLAIGGPEMLKQFAPKPQVKDSIPKTEKVDSIQQLNPVDSLQVIQQKDSVKEDPKAISFYEASSRLNCLS